MRINVIYSLVVCGLMLIAPVNVNAQAADDIFSVEVIKDQMSFKKEDIASATVVKAGGDKYGVQIKLTAKAADKLLAMTRDNIGRKVNIVRLDKIMTSVTIETGLGGEFVVSGMTEGEAQDIAGRLKG